MAEVVCLGIVVADLIAHPVDQYPGGGELVLCDDLQRLVIQLQGAFWIAGAIADDGPVVAHFNRVRAALSTRFTAARIEERWAMSASSKVKRRRVIRSRPVAEFAARMFTW